jgi:hypothetical protein
MATNINKWVRCANIGSIVLALAIGALLSWKLVQAGVVGDLSRAVSNSVAGSGQQTKQWTLKFALATDCSFCDKSLGFYRALLSSRIGKEFKAVAVFQEPVPMAQEYLRSKGLVFDEVEQASFEDIEVIGTPTLLLVDDDGALNRRWQGFVLEESEREVAEVVGVESIFPAAKHAEKLRAREAEHNLRVPTLQIGELKRLLAAKSATLIDVRKRRTYEREHLAGAINIPAGEISTVDLNIIPASETLVVFCEDNDACVREPDPSDKPENCRLAASMFLSRNVPNVRLVRAALRDLEDAGLAVVRMTETSGQ